jgi:hypothetical protein
MEEQRAIDKVAIPYDLDLTSEDNIEDMDENLLPEVVGFGWNSEEEEKEVLTEELGPEWVEENWKPWVERKAELEAE